MNQYYMKTELTKPEKKPLNTTYYWKYYKVRERSSDLHFTNKNHIASSINSKYNTIRILTTSFTHEYHTHTCLFLTKMNACSQNLFQAKAFLLNVHHHKLHKKLKKKTTVTITIIIIILIITHMENYTQNKDYTNNYNAENLNA